MRLREVTPLPDERLFRLPAPPAYWVMQRGRQPKPKLRAELSAFAPSLASAQRLALLKRAWELYKSR